MKKFNSMQVGFISLAILALVSIGLVQSCQKDEQTVSKIETPKELNEIEQMEHRTGVTMVKTVKTIGDSEGNSISILIAAPQQSQIDAYLNTVEISLELLKEKPVATNSGQVEVLEHSPLLEKETETTSGLNFEIIAKNISPEAPAYRINFAPKSSTEPLIGAIDRDFPFDETWHSALFEEGINLAFTSSTCFSKQMEVEHATKHCALCGYKVYSLGSIFPGSNWYSCNDGRRTRLTVRTFCTITTFVWGFNFINC
jgi:hypothetical protein